MTKTKTELKSTGNAYTLFDRLDEVRDQILVLKQQEDALKDSIFEAYSTQIANAYKEKGDPFGSISFSVGGLKLVFTTPKKVAWDQAGLKKLYAEGAPVSVEYNVPEAVFKAQDQDGRDALMSYRTTTPGSTSIKIERE
jgi:hypothetical protein